MAVVLVYCHVTQLMAWHMLVKPCRLTCMLSSYNRLVSVAFMLLVETQVITSHDHGIICRLMFDHMHIC